MAKKKTSGLNIRRYKKGDKAGERKLSPGGRNDDITDALAGCGDVDDIVNLATEFGMTEKEVRERASNAPNFGQFRMVVGNRIRGIVNRLSKAKANGVELSLEDAAYPPKKTRTATKKTSKKVSKKTTSKKKVAKKAAKKTATKKTPRKKAAKKVAAAG